MNGSARLSVESVSGPDQGAGGVLLHAARRRPLEPRRLGKAASLAKLPQLGPASLPANKRRHFFTPFDLMNFGFNPILPPYPLAGTSWSAKAGQRDFDVFGGTGRRGSWASSG